MKEFKHTPGPWFRNGATVFALHHVGWDKGSPLMVNRFSFTVYPDYRHDNAKEEAIATAKLVVAAPDLLEACHWALAFNKNGEAHDKLIIEKLDAAIKKAIE